MAPLLLSCGFSCAGTLTSSSRSRRLDQQTEQKLQVEAPLAFYCEGFFVPGPDETGKIKHAADLRGVS